MLSSALVKPWRSLGSILNRNDGSGVFSGWRGDKKPLREGHGLPRAPDWTSLVCCGRGPRCSSGWHIYRVTTAMQQGKMGPLAPGPAGFGDEPFLISSLHMTVFLSSACCSTARFLFHQRDTDAISAYLPFLSVAKSLIFIAEEQWSPPTLLGCLHEPRMGI